MDLTLFAHYMHRRPSTCACNRRINSNSTLRLSCYAVILFLKPWGYSLLGNIVLSLQVVHHAESWLPFEATPLRRPTAYGA
jgi:hypothetical protein